MSALTGPANILSAQAQPPAQANNAQPDAAETPFASVLQQKVQNGNQSGNQDGKPADTTTAQADQANAAQQVPQADAKSDTPTATALVNGTYTDTALQQLLPLLQSLQSKGGQHDSKDKTAANDESLLPTAAPITPQTQPLQDLELNAKPDVSKNAGKEASVLQADTLKNDEKAASATANLAASNTLVASDGKHKPQGESFDNVLQNVRTDATPTQTAPVDTGTAKTDGDTNRLQSQVGTPQWQSEFSDRVQLMSRNNESRAELVLTPPHLGRIEVTLNISGDQASASFVSANPEVRTALEGAMDRLRESFANNGISLGQTQVGAESSGQSYTGNQGGHRQSAAMGSGIQEGGASVAWTRQSNNMLDVFA